MSQMYAFYFYKKQDNSLNRNKNNIVWGNYDDLDFKVISNDNLDDIITISKSSVFEQDENFNQIDFPSSIIVTYSLCNNMEEAEIFDLNNWKESLNKRFFTITLLTLNNRQSLNDLSEAVNQIDKSAKKHELDIKCFGTLSTFDLCILTLSNEIDNIINFAYDLQKIEFKENANILTSYSIVNYISNDYSCKLSERDCNDCIANIQITYKNGMDTNTLINRIAEELIKANDGKIENIETYTVLGEYDLCLHIPLEQLPVSLFSDDGILNSNSDFFKENIQQCNTRFAKRKNYKIDDMENPMEISIEKSLIEENGSSNVITNVINELNSNDFFKESRVNKLVCHLLYIDFLKAYSLQQDGKIAKDLRYQFEAIVKCIITVYSGYNIKIDDYNEIASELSILFSSSVHNIVQAYDLTIGEPYSYFKNTAIFQKVFLSYYSFVKSLLALIYLNCSDKQSELVPIITFEPVNIPMSDLYLYIENNAPDAVDQQRIISLRLPFDSIVKLEVYLPLLVHEISHYLCPIDRISRNQLMLKLCFKHYFSSMLFDICKNKYQNAPAIFTDYQKFVSSWVDSNIEEIVKLLKDNNFLNFTTLGLTFSDRLEIILDCCFSKYHDKYEDEIVNGNALEFLYNIFKTIFDDWIKQSKLKSSEDEYLDKDIIILYGRNDQYIKEISQISSGIKEAVCDTMMINFFNLSPACYFALIVISMLNQRLKNNDSNEGLDSIIRMGLISSYLNEKNKDYNFNFSNENNEQIEKIIYLIDKNYGNDKYKDEIKQNIKQINNNISKFKRIYSEYTNEFKSITECYNIDDFANIDNITKYSKDESMSKYLINFIDTLNIVIETYENYEKDVEISRINTNINIISKLFNQMSLSELGKLYKNCQASKSKKDSKIVSKEKGHQEGKGALMSLFTDFILEDNNFNYAIRDAKAILMDDDYPNDVLWYRGQEYAEWGVTPALFRYDSQNFRNKLIDSYEWFRAEACESLEIHTNIDSNADWIACMQHYFIPTHFLDWSEQPFPALYFALENYFDYPCKFSSKEPIPECSKVDTLKGDAALFVLNPYRMNRILNDLHGIPNPSIKYNERELMEYVLPTRNASGFVTIEDSKDFFRHPKNDKWGYMPIAVMTSQLNSRIKAQKGHFIAYNLQVNYNVDKEDKEKVKKITNLYNIQENLYKISNEKGKTFKPFMAKVIIPYKVKEKMANLLNIYGINKSTYYPELMNIGDDITKHIFK